MGFIGNIFRTLFNPRIPKIPKPELTGRELVGETSSKEAEEPELGGRKDKKRGISNLLVPQENLYRGAR